jgi:probable HAF family extracellular repeat protein
MRRTLWPVVLLTLAGCHDSPEAPVTPVPGPIAANSTDGGVINLGSLNGYGASGAYAINDRGQVVGYSAAGWPNFSCCRGFLWDAGQMQDLGSLRPDGSGNVVAWDINNAGQVVGYSSSPNSTKSAFLWQNGVMQDLGVSFGSAESEARGINENGAVVGFTGQFSLPTRAWLWTSSGGMQLLPDYPDPNYSGTIAQAVNDQLMIVGQANTVNGTNPIGRAFVWTPTGGMQDPGLPPHGLYVSFEDVNNAGQAVGYAWMDSTENWQRHAIRWSAAAGWEDLAVTLDPYNESWAFAIAPDGTAGGQGDFASLRCKRNDKQCGMVWSPDGTVIRLPIAGDYFESNSVIYGLNGQGQAVGWAAFSGFPGATLWNIPGAVAGNPVAVTGGPYTAPEGTPIGFDGSASIDPQGDPLTLSWNFGDSSAFGSGTTSSHSYADNYFGNNPYTLTLYARDPGGALGAATTTVTILNVAPSLTVVAPDSLKVSVAGTVTLQFSDPGVLDAPWKLRLDWGDGTPAFTSSANTTGSVSPTHTFAAAGTFQLVARVVDKDSGATADTVQLRVVPFNRPPTASAGGPYSVAEGVPLSFDASHSTDPDGDPLTYAWDFGDGSAGTGAAPSHTYLRSGSYTVSLTATDPLGLSSITTVTAAATNLPPVVIAGADTTIPAGGIGWISGTFTDPGTSDGPWTVDIDWGNGVVSQGQPRQVVGPINGSGLGYNTPGVYTVTLTLTDAAGLSGSDQFVITVAGNGGPIASANGPYSGKEGVGIAMSSAGTINPGGGALTYRWTFGDGSAAATAANPTHIYTDNGVYSVTLKVTDGSGRSNSASTTATVANVAPTATFTKPASVAEGARFTLSLTTPKDVAPDKAAGFQYAFNCGSGFGGFSSAASLSCPARPDNGSVTVGGQIQDKDGGVRTYSGSLSVTNVAPKVTISAGGPTNIASGTTFNLNGSFTDPGTQDAPWTYSIAWGDGTAATTGTGTPGTPIAASHRYTKVGSWVVKMTVTDKNGGKGTSNAVTVTVH